MTDFDPIDTDVFDAPIRPPAFGLIVDRPHDAVPVEVPREQTRAYRFASPEITPRLRAALDLP